MKFVRLQTAALGLIATASLGLSACSGGGGSSPTASNVATSATTSSLSQKLGITLTGTSGTLARRHILVVAGTPIAVTYNGATVGTGTLDANGFAELAFTAAVPVGSTVVATIGSGANAIVASIVLASAIPATASLVTYTAGPPPAIHVGSAEDLNGNGRYDATAPEDEEQDEDASSGTVSTVLNNNNQALPSNLPLTITACGTTVTIALNAMSSPPTSGSYALDVRERTHDDESHGEQGYHFDPFSSPVTIVAATYESRIQLELTQNGNEILKLKAPLSAFTPKAGTPNACPTVNASPAPSASASASASRVASPFASASPIASASASASPMASASASASPVASASPAGSPMATKTP